MYHNYAQERRVDRNGSLIHSFFLNPHAASEFDSKTQLTHNPVSMFSSSSTMAKAITGFTITKPTLHTSNLHPHKSTLISHSKQVYYISLLTQKFHLFKGFQFDHHITILAALKLWSFQLSTIGKFPFPTILFLDKELTYTQKFIHMFLYNKQPEVTKCKRGSLSRVNAFPDWQLMAVLVDHLDGQRDLVTHKSIVHLSDGAIKNVCKCLIVLNYLLY